MSRAINVDAAESDVVATCKKHRLAVSAIEALVSGGTRVVLMNGDAAETARQVFGKKVIVGDVRRTPLRTRDR